MKLTGWKRAAGIQRLRAQDCREARKHSRSGLLLALSRGQRNSQLRCQRLSAVAKWRATPANTIAWLAAANGQIGVHASGALPVASTTRRL